MIRERCSDFNQDSQSWRIKAEVDPRLHPPPRPPLRPHIRLQQDAMRRVAVTRYFILFILYIMSLAFVLILSFYFYEP